MHKSTQMRATMSWASNHDMQTNGSRHTWWACHKKSKKQNGFVIRWFDYEPKPRSYYGSGYRHYNYYKNKYQSNSDWYIIIIHNNTACPIGLSAHSRVRSSTAPLFRGAVASHVRGARCWSSSWRRSLVEVDEVLRVDDYLKESI